MKKKRKQMPYIPANGPELLNYWTEYSMAAHKLILKCAEIISDNQVKIYFNDNRPRCITCGHHYDIYECKCPKCFDKAKIERDDALLKARHWKSRYENIAGEE